MQMDLFGWLLVLLFGLKHGLAADHIAIIDGLGMHLNNQGKSRIVPWLGTLFAIGHGIVISFFIGFIHLGAHKLHFEGAVFTWLEWLPIGLLFMISFLNFRALMKRTPHRHINVIPAAPGHAKKGALPALLIGVCMIMVFDTLADAAAWGYTAAMSGSLMAALAVGGMFTFGMLITDTIDSRLLAKTIKKGTVNHEAQRQRRILSWIIVISSFVIALQKMFALFNATFALSETGNLTIGLLLIVAVAVSYIKIYRAVSQKPYLQK